MTPYLITFDHIPPRSRVAVAMSGGVDSSVAACMLAHSGYEVVGITLQLYDQGEMAKKKGACCAGQDIYDAKMVASKMGFTHYVLDYESVFKTQVIDDFVQSYLKGQTPLPCVRCNQQVKFHDLLKTAKNLDAYCLVTGHYVQRIMVDGKAQMHRAVDHRRDQSYFLFATTQEQLDFLSFPLGGLASKKDTRSIAQYFGLNVHDKPDSQDICFVPNGDYAAVVSKMHPQALHPGLIEDQYGNVLGHHDGIIHFTIGQRKGLKIAHPHPLYVIHIDPQAQKVIVGPKEALATNALHLRDVNLLDSVENFSHPRRIQVKIRSTHQPVDAWVVVNHAHDTSASSFLGTAQVILDQPEYGVADGQACVFYEKTRVLGGGWISNQQA
jgi:tRNA-specific 2-thiouridylase